MVQRSLRYVLVSLVILFSLSSGQGLSAWDGKAPKSRAYYMAKSTGDDDWEKRYWLEKVIPLLRGGEVLSPDEDVDALLQLSKQEIIDQLMKDPRFGDAVFDFNMFFMGFRLDSLKVKGKYNLQAMLFSNAIESARQVLNGGDYFKVFDFKSPFYMDRVKVGRFGQAEDEKSLSDSEFMELRFKKVENQINADIAQLSSNPEMPTAESCALLEKNSQTYLDLFFSFPQGVTEAAALESKWFFPILEMCTKPKEFTTKNLINQLGSALTFGQQLQPKFMALMDPNYWPRNLMEFRPFDLQDAGFGLQWHLYNPILRQKITNSSTNLDRKRAAYVLKQFFCDDLTPIGVEDTGQAGSQHGSQASCQSCHYKLDPMAGYFRNHGFFFTDFTGSPKITFDDAAKADLNVYNQNWAAPGGSGRTWNVGYVRSTTNESINSYGDKLEDLHTVFRAAPEVKKCLVRRMFEYTVAENQTIDGSYLDYLSAELEKRSDENQNGNSSAAFKWVLSQLLLSESFAQIDIDPEKCYDYKPGYDPSDAPPCRVGFILRNNCAKCHDSTSAKGNLDLTRWITLADGTKAFPHLDQGNQVPLAKTIDQMVLRLSSPDPDFRMPPTYLSSQERQQLFLWAQEMQKGFSQ